MNILELQKQISTLLKTKTTRVYFQSAPQNAAYPYVVFDIVDSFQEYSNREDFRLEIDIWDDEADTTALETLSGSIDGDGHVFEATGLNRKRFYVNGSIAAKVYRENRLSIPNEDPRIKRRQLVYTIHAYISE